MKTTMMAIVLLLASGLACAQTPDWVTGKSSQYPDELYITGVGSGDSRQEAENQARAQIAEVFRVQLNARFTNNKTETLDGSGGNVNGQSVDITRSLVNVGLVKTLEGSEIADVWQDPTDMEYYALAVLDRQKASVRIADQISALDTVLVEVGAQIDTVQSKLGKLRLLASRKDIAVKRQDLNSDYSILSSSGQGLPLPGISAEEANSDLVKFCQNEISFSLHSKGPGSGSAKQVLSDGLTSMGFVINNSGSTEPDFRIDIVSNLDPSDTPIDGWYFCRWNVEVRVTSNENGIILTDVSKSGRSGQLTVGRARYRAVYDMDRVVRNLTAEMTKKLMGE